MTTVRVRANYYVFGLGPGQEGQLEYTIQVQHAINLGLVDLISGPTPPIPPTSQYVTEIELAFAIANQPAASQTARGTVELATSAETVTGTDLVRATHPAGVRAALDAQHAIYAAQFVPFTGVGDLDAVAANTSFIDAYIRTDGSDAFWPARKLAPALVWNGVTNDTTALQAALTAAATAGGGTVLLPRGTGAIAGPIDVPDGVNVVGHGPGIDASGRMGTTILLTHASASLRFGVGATGYGNRGGTSGNFTVDGNAVATECVRIGVSVGRTFSDMYAINSAGVGMVLSGSQNNNFHRCDTDQNASHGLVLDGGCGGNLFVGFESNANAGHGVVVQQTETPVGYLRPTHNTFYSAVIERQSGATSSAVVLLDGVRTKFVESVFYQATIGTARTVFQVSSTGAQNEFSGAISSDTAVSTTLIKIAANCALTLSGSVVLENGLNGFDMVATTAILNVFGALQFGSVTNKFMGGLYAPNQVLASRSYVAQWLRTSSAIHPALVVYNDASAYPGLQVWGNGQISWYGASYTEDTWIKRDAAGVVATGAAGCFRTGRAVTGSRPAAATVLAGSMFYDTTLSKPIWSDGTVWRDAAGTAV